MAGFRWFKILAVVLLIASPAVADKAPTTDTLSIERLYSVGTGGGATAGENFTPMPKLYTPVQGQRCCKICRKGKACGNSCIARWKTCRKPPGCACDAR